MTVTPTMSASRNNRWARRSKPARSMAINDCSRWFFQPFLAIWSAPVGARAQTIDLAETGRPRSAADALTGGRISTGPAGDGGIGVPDSDQVVVVLGQRSAGLTLHYNSGAVEGNVNRIRQLKMAM